MAWFWPFGKQSTPAVPASIERKCKYARSALAGCRKANTGSAAAVACKNLESNLVLCLAEGLVQAEQQCKQQVDEHRRCYTSLYKVGTYKGVGHCNTYEQAMRECLKKRGLYPV